MWIGYYSYIHRHYWASDSTSRSVSVPQDMLPMPGDPTQGTTNYNIEDFADLGMFPPFSE